MRKEDREHSFIFKGTVYPKSGNVRYDQYKCRIIEKGKTMELTKEQFEDIISLDCAYCGDSSNKMGIDRVDSSIGYTLTNSVPCCWVCNLMKYTHNLKFFLNHVNKIAAFQEVSKLV